MDSACSQKKYIEKIGWLKLLKSTYTETKRKEKVIIVNSEIHLSEFSALAAHFFHLTQPVRHRVVACSRLENGSCRIQIIASYSWLRRTTPKLSVLKKRFNISYRTCDWEHVPGARPCLANRKIGAVEGSRDRIWRRRSRGVFLKSSTRK